MQKAETRVEMDMKTDRRKKFLFPKVFGTEEKKASSRSSTEGSINSTVDFKGSPVQSPTASPSASASFFKSLSEHRSLKFSSFSSPASSASTHTEACRVFAATWNVGGKPPNIGLNLNDFLPSDDHSDIYVLGFQEVVPLNAGNVLVIEDSEPAARWLTLINQALNRPSDFAADAANCSFSQSADTFNSPASTLNTPVSRDSRSGPLDPSLFRKSSLKEVRRTFAIARGRRLKSCNCPMERPNRSYRASCLSCRKNYISESDSSDEEDASEEVSSSFTVTDIAAAFPNTSNFQRYYLVACKQMVGLFVTVWVRKEMVQHLGHVRISCVGRGIMGYLGNKGCISVSMSLHQTSLCFVCSHLASGEKEGDELKRNSDVVEILKHTQFRRTCKRSGRRIPEKILEHDRVIWLGDLNYRIALSYSETKQLLEANKWDALFEKDQLKTEIESGVFRGWNEGKIFFAPTYKYSWNSDNYAGESVMSKKKRRNPAWCDRILWHGEGIVQLSYIRGESKFSDHRPVCAVFIVEVGVLDTKLKKVVTAINMKVGAEELLPRNSISFP